MGHGAPGGKKLPLIFWNARLLVNCLRLSNTMLPTSGYSAPKSTCDTSTVSAKKMICFLVYIGVTPACLYGTETLALTELQQQRLQVCENNCVRKIGQTGEEWWS